jgi:circadian clock protein KaiC
VSGAANRISSAHARLDAIFADGLPANAINLIIGLPGTGKTILAQQYVYANATVDRPALYVSTVAEPFDKIIRYGQTLDFFDPQAVGRSVFYEDVSRPLSEQGLSGAGEEIDRLIKERRPTMVVIDSFKALAEYSENRREFRQFVHDLAGRLSAIAGTSFWVGEYTVDELATAPEFAVADAIICLRTERSGDRERRLLEVLKLRGSSFASGDHAYRISTAGIDVFPRLADQTDHLDYPLGPTRVASGIPFLDEMLAEGYFPGSTTLVQGPTGVGKTLMGLHYIFHGARGGEPGLIATLSENPTQLERVANRFGWSLQEDGVELMYRSPVDLYVDQWVYELLDTIERTGARRVLIDSLNELGFAATDPVRLREYLYSLTQRCSRAGVSLLMTREVAELFQPPRLSELLIAQICDNAVLLHYTRARSGIGRVVMILKTRGSDHQREIREFAITPDGIVLGDELEAADLV